MLLPSVVIYIDRYLVVEVEDSVEPRSHVEIVSSAVLFQIFRCDLVLFDLPVQLLRLVDHTVTTN